MTDALPADASAPAHNRSADHGALQERLRAAIRAEIARHDPIEDARRSLELIAETSLRATEQDGRLVIRVVDMQGQARTRDENGQAVDLSLPDLVQELRVRHPALFKQDRGSPAPSGRKDQDERQRAPDPVPAGHAAPPESSPPPARLAATDAPGPHDRPSSQPVESLDRARVLLEDMRDERRPWLLMAGAAALALLVGAGAFMAWDRYPFTADKDEAVAMGSAPAGEPSTTGAVAGPPPAAAEPTSLKGAAEAIDTATLRMQGRIVRLFGVEWAEGGGKPEDLTAYLNGREVDCEPTDGADVYRCQVSGQDLSRVVLFNGGGRATAQATDELKAAESKAREAKLGVWGR